jgi:transcription elongation GreA/GreB family factor
VLSRAFVKESEGLVESLPDRQISPHPNLVTPEGLALIDATIGRLRNERSAVFGADDHASLARIERELRYWLARRSTAQVVHAPDDTTLVRFGCTVTLARDDGRQQTYRIVGEDEADPSRDTLSYVSPVARAMMGKQVGDTVPMGSSEAEILSLKCS